MDAGTYTATVTLNKNYKQLADDATQLSKEFEIQKRPVQIAAKKCNKDIWISGIMALNTMTI